MARASHAATNQLVERLTAIPGVEPLFPGPVFHERVLRLPLPVADALRALAGHNVLGGYDLGVDYPELGQALLVCATETKTEDDIEQYAAKLGRVVKAQTEAACPTTPKM